MKTTRIMKRFCCARSKEVILLEEKIEPVHIKGKTKWKVLLCRDLDEECQIKVCELVNKIFE